MTIHKLKLAACYYADSASGIKTFEIRKNDRDFRVGDILELREWVGEEGMGRYSGETHWKIITYILDDAEYLQDGYVCLGVSTIAEPQNPKLSELKPSTLAADHKKCQDAKEVDNE